MLKAIGVVVVIALITLGLFWLIDNIRLKVAAAKPKPNRK